MYYKCTTIILRRQPRRVPHKQSKHIRAIAATTFDVDATVGQSYSFYFVIETDGKKFTSAAKTAVAPETGAAGVAFGNLQTATTTAGAWQSVPEPTSGLLLLLGMAGLALRRKQK